MDLTAIQRFRQANVLIVGDFMLDKYIGGDVQRISPEAPVPILKMLWESDRLGGAGNVVNNIQSLSAKARVLCCIGEDEAGGRLVSLLRDTGADVRFLQKARNYRPSKRRGSSPGTSRSYGSTATEAWPSRPASRAACRSNWTRSSAASTSW